MKVTEKDFEKAGGNPYNIPAIQKEMSNIPQAIKEEEEERFENGDSFADAQEMMPEGEPLLPCVAGVRVVRDVTPGVFNILNKMKSPLVTGEECDDNEYFQELAFLLYLLSFRDVAQLVRWFHDKTLRTQFEIWSFDNLSLEKLMREHEEITEMLESLSNAAIEIPGDAEGEGGKKSVG